MPYLLGIFDIFATKSDPLSQHALCWERGRGEGLEDADYYLRR
jgi:hypothetical protein